MPKQEVATAAQNAGLPAHLQQGKTSRLGNTDRSDLIIPRLKLLQGISPEVETFDAAKTGNFWHTLLEENLGPEVRVVPVLIRKSIALWAPRGDDRGILARSNDMVRWDRAEKFEVKLKNVKEKVIWDTTSGLVDESGLTKFGSMNPNDPDSQPAAALTYNWLFYLPDHADLSPVMVINTRSSVRPAKLLVSKIEIRPVDHFGQAFVMRTKQEQGAEGTYYNYQYDADGFADAKSYEAAKAMYESMKDQDFRASDEGDESGGSDGGAKGTEGGKKGKF